jgi:hypothetical protein
VGSATIVVVMPVDRVNLKYVETGAERTLAQLARVWNYMSLRKRFWHKLAVTFRLQPLNLAYDPLIGHRTPNANYPSIKRFQ